MIPSVSLYHLLSVGQLTKRRAIRNSEMLTLTAATCQRPKVQFSFPKILAHGRAVDRRLM